MSDSIEQRIETVLQALEKYKETHPIFVKVWSLYLREKLNNLEIVVSKCEQVSNSDLTNTPDLDAELLASLVTLF